jgi:hypothetical protein
MAIAFVGGATNRSSTSFSSLAITYSPTAGNTVIIAAAIDTTTGNISSISDNATGGSSVYSSVNSVLNSTRAVLWSTAAGGIKAGVTTITINFSATLPSDGAVLDVEYSGVLRLGQNATKTGSGSAVSQQPGFTTQDANNVVLAIIGANTTGFAAVSGTNLRESTTSTISRNGALIDQAVASAGTNPTLKVTNTSANAWAGVFFELRSTATGSSNTNQLMMVGCGT